MRWLVRLRCEKGEDMVLSESTAIVQSPRCLHRSQKPIRDTCGSWTVEGLRSYARIGSRPQFLLLVETGTALLDVTVTCFTCPMMLEAQRRQPFHLALGIPCATLLFFWHSRGTMCMGITLLLEKFATYSGLWISPQCTCYAFRRFVCPVTDARKVPATVYRLTLVTHHGFCELELLYDRNGRVADAVALPRSSDNGTSSSGSDRKSSGLSRRHLLNPSYHTTAVGCRHICCLFPFAASESTIGGLSAA